MTKFGFTKLERLKLIGQCIKAVTGVVGGSLILTEGHPYITLAVLSVGAIANEIVITIREKENKKIAGELVEVVAKDEEKE